MRNGSYKIERGIQIPKPKGGKKSVLAALMRSMRIGDSIFLKKQEGNARKTAARYIGVGKYVSRIERDGFRIWKIK